MPQLRLAAGGVQLHGQRRRPERRRALAPAGPDDEQRRGAAVDGDEAVAADGEVGGEARSTTPASTPVLEHEVARALERFAPAGRHDPDRARRRGGGVGSIASRAPMAARRRGPRLADGLVPLRRRCPSSRRRSPQASAPAGDAARCASRPRPLWRWRPRRGPALSVVHRRLRRPPPGEPGTATYTPRRVETPGRAPAHRGRAAAARAARGAAAWPTSSSSTSPTPPTTPGCVRWCPRRRSPTVSTARRPATPRRCGPTARSVAAEIARLEATQDELLDRLLAETPLSPAASRPSRRQIVSRPTCGGVAPSGARSPTVPQPAGKETADGHACGDRRGRSHHSSRSQGDAGGRGLRRRRRDRPWRRGRRPGARARTRPGHPRRPDARPRRPVRGPRDLGAQEVGRADPHRLLASATSSSRPATPAPWPTWSSRSSGPS